MAVIGVGIVGCGGNGLNHAEVWSSIEEAKIMGVCDIDEGRAKERAKLLGVKAFTRVEDLVKEPGVDAIDVVTSGSHLAPTLIAAQAGKHVLVETPFSATIEECDQMIAATEKAGVKVMYGQIHRFLSLNLKAKELVDQGEVGEPISMEMTYLGSGSATLTAWHRWLAQGGGYFMYEGTCWIDQIKWLMGSTVESVFTVGMGRYVSGGDGEDNGIAGFTLKNGAFATIYRGCSDQGAKLSSWRLVGTKGMLDQVYPGQLRLGRDGEWKDISFPFKDAPMVKTVAREREAMNFNGFRTEFKEFLDSIVEGRQPSCSAYDGKAATEAALAVVKSHQTGQPVRLPPAG